MPSHGLIYSGQDILLCELCQTAALQSHCELCHVNLCIVCVGKHLSDSSKRHNVVPYKHKTSTPNNPICPIHAHKHCELFCEKCDIPVCSTCLSSRKHKGHDLSDVLQKMNSKTKDVEKDLEELEKRIYPTYRKIAADLKSEKVNVEEHYAELTTAVNKQGEDLHKEINNLVFKRKSEIEEMKVKHLTILNKQENEIKGNTANVLKTILQLKKTLASDNNLLASSYESRNFEFRNLLSTVTISLPNISFPQINNEKLNEMLGFLTASSIELAKHGYTMKTVDAVSCPLVKPLLEEPELITTLDTGYDELNSVIYLGKNKIWTCGNNKTMKLFNLQGKRLMSIKTNSRNTPYAIAVTGSGDLAYTDYEKQTIHFDSEGKPLFSYGFFSKYICENRNLDICVTDCDAASVVVVNKAGKLRFRYTGNSSTEKESFYPFGITTDSQSQILTADFVNHCIHILDQDGQFLSYIDNCDLSYPWSLCVDNRDNLFLTEYGIDTVKKIKYM
ncbi:E3 ubiquitin-protein ligase TRIM36-like [Saccostrea cucullata]|uniref:E3 ubiquitin-protein ligase TRIM36-like n=1 Tax=Saccostrea cuccullata TaxID=36930 RepID=UPI002ED4AD24